MSELPFPSEVHAAAAAHGISPALALGLGEGLNLYYSRRSHESPPHWLRVLPPQFPAPLAARLLLPRPVAVAEALASNAHGMLLCTGDWHGLDAIEKWGEDLSRWPAMEGWEASVRMAAGLIETSEGLYRRSYTLFLDEASGWFDGLAAPRALLDEIASEWLDIAARLRRAESLERVGSRVLRMAARESRFWGSILDRFGPNGAER